MLTEEQFYFLNQNKEMLTSFLKSNYPALSYLNKYYDMVIINLYNRYIVRYYYHEIIYDYNDHNYYEDFYGYPIIENNYKTEIKSMEISISTDNLVEIYKKMKLNSFL